MAPSERAQFKGMHLTPFPPPAGAAGGAAGGAGCGRLGAGIYNFLSTCFPCSHIFPLPLGGCTTAWLAAVWRQNSTLQHAFRLLTVAWLQAALPCHSLSVCRINCALAKQVEKQSFHWVLQRSSLLQLVQLDDYGCLETRPV